MVPHRDPLAAAQARIASLERALELAQEARTDLAMYASIHAELEHLRAENDALRAELAALARTLDEEREARRVSVGSERAGYEAELARLRDEVDELRAVVAASRARATRAEPEPELEPQANVLRVDPDRVAEGGSCPSCHAERALSLHPTEDGLASSVCVRCGYVELRTLG